MSDYPDQSTPHGRLWWALWDNYTPEAKEAFISEYQGQAITDASPMLRAKVLTEAVSKLREAQYAQRSNTARHTHYSEAAEIVHRMISE